MIVESRFCMNIAHATIRLMTSWCERGGVPPVSGAGGSRGAAFISARYSRGLSRESALAERPRVQEPPVLPQLLRAVGAEDGCSGEGFRAISEGCANSPSSV